jgi:hypothetical protein
MSLANRVIGGVPKRSGFSTYSVDGGGSFRITPSEHNLNIRYDKDDGDRFILRPSGNELEFNFPSPEFRPLAMGAFCPSRPDGGRLLRQSSFSFGPMK